MAEGNTGSELVGWKRIWFKPILKALYLEDVDSGDEAAHKARESLYHSDLVPENMEKAHYALKWFEYHLKRIRNGGKPGIREFTRAIAGLGEPAFTPGGERERMRYLVCLLIQGERHGYQELTREDLLRYIDGIGETQQDADLWHHIATWAFDHRDEDLLARAFEVLLVNPCDILPKAKWLRVNLMYLLVAGRANREDIRETILSLTVLAQLQEFKQHIWPYCIELGLASPELEGLLASQAEAVRSSPSIPEAEHHSVTG